MASDRIEKNIAQACPLPPHTWYWIKASEVLSQQLVKDNINAVGLNKPLVESLQKEPEIYNPILCLSTWWPLVGSQRLRAIQEIRDTINPNYDPNLKIARIDKDYLNYTLLWPDKEFSAKVRMVTFQMWELIFKSLWFEVEQTKDGIPMTEFEDEGDRNEGWKYATRKVSDEQPSQQRDDQE